MSKNSTTTTVKYLNDLFYKYVQKPYWGAFPPNWRPLEIYYRCKCFLWHRYTTVKPRTLHFHTWCDKVELVPHICFELLSQFIEQECSPGNIEWYGEYGHQIEIDEKQKYVMDEMIDLYYWWHYCYLEKFEEYEKELFDITQRNKPIQTWSDLVDQPGYSQYDPKFDSREKEKIYNETVEKMMEFEKYKERSLNEMMHRLVNIIPYMWT